MRPVGEFATTHQEPYIRTRENPYFDGLLRSNNIGETRPKNFVSDMSEDVMDLSLDNSAVSIFNYESSEHSSSERWLKTSKIAPFIQLDIQSELIELANPKHLGYAKTYIVTRRREKLSSILLPLSAASYYNGVSPEMEIVESCESIDKLNAYLKARKDDVNAGVPGKFLHAVMGSDDADVGTVASTIMYSFYLNISSENDQFCTVPIININRANLGSHVELKWLLDSCNIDQSSLIFADEASSITLFYVQLYVKQIDLSYYDLFGSLKIVLLKSSRIARKQEKLKRAVVEIFHCRKGETIHPWVKTVATEEENSCCTAIADKFATYSPEILASKSFSKLLLAGILLDTANLKDPHCTSKDKYMASLLINGAGRYGFNGLYQLLRHKMHDLSSLQVADILRKDLKKWTGQVSERLRVLIVVSGYYNEGKNFKREVLVSTESVKLLESLLFFFDFNASRLPLKSLKNEMKAYEIDKITSRKTLEHLIEEFIGIPKA
ncbi:exopolyphosphatase PRUNE1-like [Abrus precatorius]|uniref:Exopolyphosphatase PRUNE1-like n=1 Tax=Abrus precatorius TaxID=3816 RepID=A0A8B8LK64_ABRPR|nr:exopolyphosphatase PRUNE1-like [Abrus precatorius]